MNLYPSFPNLPKKKATREKARQRLGSSRVAGSRRHLAIEDVVVGTYAGDLLGGAAPPF